MGPGTWSLVTIVGVLDFTGGSAAAVVPIRIELFDELLGRGIGGQAAVVGEGELREVREIGEPGRNLTDQLVVRQVEILQGIADGMSTKQVARDLGITQKTVHNHLNAIYRRLDTQSLTHAVLSAVRLGIIDLRED